ncbi:MucR family transcriptional regulator [Novosphingobium sp. TH158]|uniref:MucR family transcriptional regulator n=1 Tax=Novosphingobium sp. TH158 TaxID=2067455 RepID=UPI000C7D97D3|nr:MucR family transcriptional regulator [Novosphingobium sp. TH158]PLK26528.1 transcriptional regulator [Novosphingobium sp. TH158]
METPAYDMKETLITLTSDIVAAHVSNNNVSTEEVTSLISNVYSALANLGAPAAPVVEAPKPAVSARASVKPGKVVCMDCGMELQMLKRHLMTHHGMTVEEYRAKWGLSADHPIVAPNYAERRRELAKKIGLGRKPGTKMPKKAAPAGDGTPAKRGRPKKVS